MTVGIPNGLCSPLSFGMYTRLIGKGRYSPCRIIAVSFQGSQRNIPSIPLFSCRLLRVNLYWLAPFHGFPQIPPGEYSVQRDRLKSFATHEFNPVSALNSSSAVLVFRTTMAEVGRVLPIFLLTLIGFPPFAGLLVWSFPVTLRYYDRC